LMPSESRLRTSVEAHFVWTNSGCTFGIGLGSIG
jgi:hypothetical protein